MGFDLQDLFPYMSMPHSLMLSDMGKWRDSIRNQMRQFATKNCSQEKVLCLKLH